MAVLADGKLYVATGPNADAVYLLEDGKAEKVIDLSEEEGKEKSRVIDLEAYRPEGSSKEVLAVCMNNGILTYSDGNITEKDVVIKINPSLLMWLEKLLEYVESIAIFGLIVNLIIRKKTLLYKQLIVTLPIFIAITITLAFRLYIYSVE